MTAIRITHGHARHWIKGDGNEFVAGSPFICISQHSSHLKLLDKSKLFLISQLILIAQGLRPNGEGFDRFKT
jgi:hypothetical protein